MATLQQVIQHITSQLSVTSVSGYDRKRPVIRAEIPGNNTLYDPDTLYILPDSGMDGLSLPLHPEQYLMLTGPDGADAYPFSPVCLNERLKATVLFELINCFLKNETTVESHINQLYHALYSGHGLKDIVTAAERFLNHPVSVCDASYNIIETSSMMDRMPYGIERNSSRTFLTASEVESLKRLHIESQIYENKNAFLCRTADHPDSNWIFCAIRIQNVMAGYVAVCLEANIEASPYELRMTTVLADVCAIEMQKHDFFITRSGMKYENFLIDLLEGRFHDVNMISSRLELLDRKFCSFFCLVVLTCMEPHDSNLFNKRQMSTLRTVYTNSMSVVYNDAIVLFLNQEKPILLNETFTGPLQEFAERNHMKAAFSQPFRDILKIHSFYHQALHTMELGESFQNGKSLFFSSDLLPQFLFSYTDYTCLEDGIHHHLKQLMDHDRENHTELIPTLRAYLKHDRNAAQAAAALHIHRSTFFYRMKKIEELLDISTTDSHLLFLYELSFRIWDYLSR